MNHTKARASVEEARQLLDLIILKKQYFELGKPLGTTSSFKHGVCVCAQHCTFAQIRAMTACSARH
jgi:hypothetical protein